MITWQRINALVLVKEFITETTSRCYDTCLHMFTRVYLCLHLLTYVDPSSLVFIYVYLFTPFYSCLPMFSYVYNCLLVFS